MREADRTRVGAPSLESSHSAYLWWLIWILWIPFVIPNIAQFIGTHPAPARLILSLTGVAVFFALYLGINLHSARRLASATPVALPAQAERWAPIAVMIALAVILVLADGQVWGSLFIYTSTCTAGRLSWRQAAVVIAGITVFTIIGVTRQGTMSSAVSAVAFILVPGSIVIAAVHSITGNQQLRVVHEEMARLAAASEERLRIARDLHDLLGHNLSLIALKSELAGRLLTVSPERAAAEIGDVERVARTALQEVREAVAGYRQPSLAGELAAAREILTAAGIVHRFEGDESASRGLPSAVDAALAWAVREGITNVIRHSGARSCTIHMMRDPDSVSVEIHDDGKGAADATTAGNGLRGLAERVEMLGGRYAFGPRTEGGFRVYVRVPLARAGQAGRSPGADSSTAAAAVVSPAAALGRAPGKTVLPSSLAEDL